MTPERPAATAGAWPTRRGLVIAVVRADAHRPDYARLEGADDDAVVVDLLIDRGVRELVVPDVLGDATLASLARAVGARVLLAPSLVLAPLLAVAGLSRRQHRAAAALLARLAAVPELRRGLVTRRSADARQLSLL